jgi:hypothetical protein
MPPADRVVILRDFPKEGIWEGAIGVVIYRKGDDLKVAFSDKDGTTVTLNLKEWEVQTVGAARFWKWLGVGLGIGLAVLWMTFPFLVSADTYYGVLFWVLVVIVVLTVVISVGRVAWRVGSEARRQRRVRTNALDPSLRPYVASDLSWENSLLIPDLSTEALSLFQFLVDEEGFDPAVIAQGAASLHFRRGDVAINVGEIVSREGVEAAVQIILFRTPRSYRIIAERVLGSISDGLGDGYRGLAFHLQTQLDQIVEDLRAEAACTQPKYLSSDINR